MTVYLDTETTGLSAARGDTIVEIAIVDHRGDALINTLVNPGRPIPSEAIRVHGISDEMVRGKPSLTQLMPQIVEIIRGQQVVIYNAKYDISFFPGRLTEAASLRCAMIGFSEALGGRRWQKLDVAARHVGHKWSGVAHRALADALACRSVWEWLQRREEEVSSRSSAAPRSDARRELDKLIIVHCRFCAQRLRVPGGRVLDVTCPKCRGVFRLRS